MMTLSGSTKRTIYNKEASLTVDMFGGAITDFHLYKDEVNPLTFAFSKAQMLENNRGGALYREHFLCLGRWGEPSAGEIKAGIPNHGQIANILWKAEEHSKDNVFRMQADSPLEGLHVNRTITIASKSPAYAVKEIVTNVNSLGRLFSIQRWQLHS